MNKYFKIILLLLIVFVSTSPKPSYGQLVLAEVIRSAIKKVVKAVDLKIQRLQNKTIWLQQAQKTMENILSKTRLDEIALWSQKQKEAFGKYYSGLMKVKSVIGQFHQVKELTEKQVAMVREYRRVWGLLQHDGHFSIEELDYMAKVYSGMLEESLKNIDGLTMIIQSYTLQMSDGQRMEILAKASDRIDENFNDLRRFNRQNILLRIQRARSEQEVLIIKQLYGLP
ncbi:conjugal transfer protein TraI [Sphingobacterium cellulitidis]|uniref:conjugal transfer protein TraI n=1 Tax=Sphingobacterium cellulitidis TaxID=1768011 RepID=UPI0015FDEC4A|nr:conjugal transfer protein TraI [Sphingobacterium soli]MBA8986200.1 hypothetical protein [Sphingobacterium soli]